MTRWQRGHPLLDGTKRLVTARDKGLCQTLVRGGELMNGTHFGERRSLAVRRCEVFLCLCVPPAHDAGAACCPILNMPAHVGSMRIGCAPEHLQTTANDIQAPTRVHASPPDENSKVAPVVVANQGSIPRRVDLADVDPWKSSIFILETVKPHSNPFCMAYAGALSVADATASTCCFAILSPRPSSDAGTGCNGVVKSSSSCCTAFTAE